MKEYLVRYYSPNVDVSTLSELEDWASNEGWDVHSSRAFHYNHHAFKGGNEHVSILLEREKESA